MRRKNTNAHQHKKIQTLTSIKCETFVISVLRISKFLLRIAKIALAKEDEAGPHVCTERTNAFKDEGTY